MRGDNRGEYERRDILMGYLENGTEVAQKLYTQYGWSRNPIVAYLGNIQQESSIDPTNFQGADGDWSMGVGFNQWTPGTNLQERAQAIGRTDYLTIDCQLAVMDYERRAGIQYYATSSYNLSFDEFIRSTNDVEWLTYAWEANYERAGSPMMENRIKYAREWDARIDGILNLRNVVEDAVEWAIGIANDDSHGYDQTHRDGPDYDCSSLLCWAYYNAGLNTRPGYTPATGTMRSVFLSAGFQDVTSQVNLSSGSGLVRGDVLLVPGSHTEMYIGNGQLVGASINEFGDVTGGQTGDQTGDEIHVHGYYNYPWEYVLRYPGGGGVTPPLGIYIVRFVPR